MSNEEENRQVILKLLKNRILLRVFNYLFELNAIFKKYPELFQYFKENEKDSISRGEILDLIKKREPNLTIYKADRILNELVNKKIIKNLDSLNNVERYSGQFFISNGKVCVKATPIADYLNEEIQSIISALKNLNRFKVRASVLLPFPLVTSFKDKKTKRETNAWTFTQEGLRIGYEIRKIFDDTIIFNEISKKEDNSETLTYLTGDIYEKICSNILKRRNEMSEIIKKIEDIKESNQATLNECTMIRGKSIDEIRYILTNKDIINESIIDEVEDLLQTIKFIRFNIAILWELRDILKKSLKHLQHLLDAQKSVFIKSDFKKFVKTLYENFNNLKDEFIIPKIYGYEEWSAFSQRQKDASLYEKEKKSLDELKILDLSKVLNIKRIYDLKFDIEKYLERNY